LQSLFDELVETYRRFYEAAKADHFEDDESWDVLCELGRAVIKIAKPKTVGDVVRLPEGVHDEGLAYLIHRDATDHYDQIDGYMDAVFADQIWLDIPPSTYEFDGLKLCEWIDQEFPQEAAS
jgi:hypothetical protein